MQRSRLGIGATIFAMAAVLGFTVARPMAPARLHAEVAARLTEALGGETEIGELRVYLGWGLRFEAQRLLAWPGPDGSGLEVERVVVDVRPFSHLTGQLRLRRIRLEGATLRVSRARDGHWQPAFLDPLLRDEPAAAASQPNELLEPLIALETAVRDLLARRSLADELQVGGARIEIRDALAMAPGAEPLRIEGLAGGMRRQLFLGGMRLALTGRIEQGAQELGSFEWAGRQERSGDLRLALALTEVRLAALTPYLRPEGGEAKLDGHLSGAVVFETPEPGHGRLEFDWIGRDLHGDAPPRDDWDIGSVDTPHVVLTGVLAIEPGQVRLEQARLATDALSFELDGTLERPLHPDSAADLSLTLRDVRVGDLRHALAWLPRVRRDEADALLARIERGQLRLLRTAGAATLSGWQDFLAGRSKKLPHHFVVDAELLDTTVRVGASDRLRDLEGRLWWTGDRFELRGFRARLNESPLPQLDLSVEGIGHLFAADPEARQLRPGAPPLDGLRPLWRTLHKKDRPPGISRIDLDIERLDHPVLFWPLSHVRAEIVPFQDGLRIGLVRAAWAGVRVEGEAEWSVAGEERVHARLVAHGAPRDAASTPAAALAPGRWAQGDFEVGPAVMGPWRHQKMAGRFTAEGSTLHLVDTEIALDPSGLAQADLRLDLGGPDTVPFEFGFSVEGGDVPAIWALWGPDGHMTSGVVDGAGSLRGNLTPGTRLAPTLAGLIDVNARDGEIRRQVPAVMAVALASEAFNPFASRETLRYTKLETLLEFEGGRLGTDALTLEGPDVRAVASGSGDLVTRENALDADIALFLFRPVDGVIQKIPIVNYLLLGKNESLVAAHFHLTGPWSDPKASLVPLRTLASGPGSLVFETFPALMKRGLRVIDDWIAPADPHEPIPLAPPAVRPSES